MFCVDNQTMKNSDQATIKSGVSSTQLMYRAAKGVFDSHEWAGKIYIICGKGNNGGDGLCLAHIMLEAGITPTVYLISKQISIDSQYYLDKILKTNSAIIKDIDACDYNCNILVDCIFGTGFRGQPNQQQSAYIQNINKSKSYVISVDIPSGLNGDNGLASIAVKANKTVAIQCPKIGCFLSDGKDYCGQVVVVDIGIDIVGEKIRIIEESELIKYFDTRKNNSNKSTFGKSAIIGGCKNYLGAVKLANLGLNALRTGGGLNVIAVPESLSFNLLSSQVMESTVFPLADINGYISFDKRQLDICLNGVNSVLYGVGLGQNYDENIKILQYILTCFKGNLIIDADGINTLSKNIDLLKQAKCNVILTPHPKEMSRLCGIDMKDILNNPLAVVNDFANKYNVCLLLKGASTLICNCLGEKVLVTNGTAALAKGGSGDTLAGVILGLLSQGISPYQACFVGAYLCASAAKKAEQKYSCYGVLPSDVSKEIAHTIKEIMDLKN